MDARVNFFVAQETQKARRGAFYLLSISTKSQTSIGKKCLIIYEFGCRNRLTRVTKTPKLQLIDAGLLATLIELTAEEVERDRTRFGKVLESFVYGELLKTTTTADGEYALMYYRDADKVEVDVVIENATGQLVGVEVKASATVKESDLKGLRKFSSLAGDQFKMGLLLCDGDETMPFS